MKSFNHYSSTTYGNSTITFNVYDEKKLLPEVITPNTLACGGALSVLKHVPTASVDFLISNLPYQVTKTEWDWVQPISSLWDEYARVCKPHAAIIFPTTQPFASIVTASLSDYYRHEWIAEKPHTTLQSQKTQTNARILQAHESYLVFSTDTPLFRPHEWGNGFRTLGPAYKPPSLLTQRAVQIPWPEMWRIKLHEYFIKSYTREDAVVLDAFMNGGEAGIACINTNRKYIGIDCDVVNFHKAVNAINAHIGKKYRFRKASASNGSTWTSAA